MTKGRNVQLPAVHVLAARHSVCGVRGEVLHDIALIT